MPTGLPYTALTSIVVGQRTSSGQDRKQTNPRGGTKRDTRGQHDLSYLTSFHCSHIRFPLQTWNVYLWIFSNASTWWRLFYRIKVLLKLLSRNAAFKKCIKLLTRWDLQCNSWSFCCRWPKMRGIFPEENLSHNKWPKVFFESTELCKIKAHKIIASVPSMLLELMITLEREKQELRGERKANLNQSDVNMQQWTLKSPAQLLFINSKETRDSDRFMPS